MKVKWTGETQFLMLTKNKVYDVIAIEKNWYRIKDDSGEDYLYPPQKFETIEAVSYTHLDVYKRQEYNIVMAYWRGQKSQKELFDRVFERVVG